MATQTQTDQLRDALLAHQTLASPFYDEAVDEIASRAQDSGSLGKADIGGLVAWKRLNGSTRWMSEFMATPNDLVRKATLNAREAALNEAVDVPSAARAARSALSPIAGFKTGDALASAVIYALAPCRMAVYDRRAQLGLEKLGLLLTSTPGRYGRYMALVTDLSIESERHGTPLKARDIDLALFALGGT
ncbi:hypothetical protein [Nocardioides sp. AX2bis]|uniref:hypothetical protein n=1 Tax=Nocardioides sp. AX2bis TaxID=2653157 RepID=UPI001915CE37|nr:hypothetical protein [Nocardioides sp. AX2bis]